MSGSSRSDRDDGPRLREVALPVVALRAGGQGLEFLGFLLFARRLGTEAFGSLSVAFLLCRYAGLVADWGATLRGPRDVAAGHGNGVHGLVRRRELTTAVLSVVYLGGALSAGWAELAPLVVCIAARGLNRDWLSLGRERGIRASSPAFAQGALLVGGAAAVDSLLGASTVVAIAYGAGLCSSLALNRLPPASGETSSRVDPWLLIATLGDQVFLTVDTLLLAALVSSSAAGIYSAVYRLPNAWMTGVGLLITGLLPGITRRLTVTPSRLGVMRRQALRVGAAGAATVLVSIPFAFILTSPILGSAYEPGRGPMVVLLCGTALMTFTACLAPIYYATGPDRHIAGWTLLTGAVNFAANLLVIPAHGMIGAAYVTLATQLLLSGFLYRQTRESVVSRRAELAGRQSRSSVR